MQKRDTFSSKFGVIAATAGSAIGLGNIWKFPYMVGENGGAAFIIIYLFFVAMIGIPVMTSEFIIGRKAKQNVFGAFKKLTNNKYWRIIGIMGVLAAFLILAFYSTIAGWTMEYLYLATKNAFANKNAHDIENMFNTFSTDTYKPIILQIIFMIISAFIVIKGIKKGIEKYTKILMPLLLLIIIYLDVTALFLKGGADGISFLFKPNFAKITPNSILNALGLAFFTLSLGMGVLMTYASYFQDNTNLTQTSISVSVADTVIALLAGIAIFPVVFAFGAKPGLGPGLVFITLPNIFLQIPGGYLFSILFFLLLGVAALTSSISLLEVVVAYLSEEQNMSRKKATIITTTIITMLGVFCTLSFSVLKNFLIAGKNIFNLFDFVASNLLLPLGGLLISVFVGWVLEHHVVKQELTNKGTVKIISIKLFIFLVKYLAPIFIFIVFLHGVGVF